MSDLQRFDLPSGGWWELELDPTHGQVEDIREQALGMLQISSDNGDGPADTDVKALISSGRITMIALTTSWSFPEAMPVTAESLRTRSAKDTAVVQDELQEHITPLLQDPVTRQRQKRNVSLQPSGSGGSPENTPT